MKNNNYKYLHFPICLLQLVHLNADPKKQIRVLDEILGWAIVNFSLTLKYKKEALVKQIIYLYYKNPDNLLPFIRNKISKMEKDGYFDRDIDRDGFDLAGKFNPDDDIILAISHKIENDDKFRENCEQQYRIGQVLKSFKLTSSIERYISEFEYLNDYYLKFEEEYSKDAWASIRIDIFLDSCNGKITINEFLFYAAAKSIIGNRNYNRTYKKAIVSRMMGVKSIHLLDEIIENEGIPIQIKDGLLTRYKFDKLKDQVIDRKLVSLISPGRGFFVSTRYSQETLWNKVIEPREKKSKKKQMNREMRLKYQMLK